MGVTGTLIVISEVVRSKPFKIGYRCVKGACVGKPALFRCAKEIAACFFEIDTKKLAGDACKRAFICLAPLGSIAGASILADIIDHPAAKGIAKFSANSAGLVLSGPAYGFDSILGPIEVLIFGEAVPIISDHRLFLFGGPFDSE